MEFETMDRHHQLVPFYYEFNMKQNHQIFLALKEILKNTELKISYRNRDGKEYITTTRSTPYVFNLNEWTIIKTAFPNAYCTSGCLESKTFRINP